MSTESEELKEAKKNLEVALAGQKKAALAESEAHDAAKAAGKQLSKTKRARIEAARISVKAQQEVGRLQS